MSKSYDRVADIYDDTRRLPAEVIGQIMDMITREIDASAGPVLEIGIGTGRVALPLAERGFRVAGVDLSEKMLMHLRAKSASLLPRPQVVRGDAARLPFSDDIFNAVLAVHVFHLIDDLDDCLVEVRRVLRPGGCLLFGGDRRTMRQIQDALQEGENDLGVGEDLINLLAGYGVKPSDGDELRKRILASAEEMSAVIEHLPPIEWDYEITCGEIVGRIEGRVTSSLWNIPEDEHEKLVRELKSQLASRVGPPETPIRYRRRFCMTCVRFPQ